MEGLLPLLLLPVLMYFLLIRPQQKKMRAQQELLRTVEEGDEVMTTSGLYGYVTAIDGDVVWLEVAEGVDVRIAKGAIARKLTEVGESAPSAGASEPSESSDANGSDDGAS